VASSRNPIVEPAERELVITRVFDAPRELVFKAWTDPRHAIKWWGPRDYPATHLEMDVRPGGTWRKHLTSTQTGKELRQRGVFREVVAPERLVFTYAWEEEGERGLETLVTVTLAEQQQTLMTARCPSSRSRNATGIVAADQQSDRLDEHLTAVRDERREEQIVRNIRRFLCPMSWICRARPEEEFEGFTALSRRRQGLA
jgi:uncharacterized protein YndB with AHSA1/START domain